MNNKSINIKLADHVTRNQKTDLIHKKQPLNSHCLWS